MATAKGGTKLAGFLNQMANRINSGKFVKSGFLKTATYADGKQVAMIAAIQNYGAPGVGIPPRPFFTNMVKDKSSGWGVAVAKNLKAANYDAEKALDRVGEGIDGQLRASIIAMNDPPLAASTVAKRKSGMTAKQIQKADDRAAKTGKVASYAKPLVDTGIMLGSVDHEVVK